MMKIEHLLNQVSGTFKALHEGKQSLKWAEITILGKIVEFVSQKEWEIEKTKERTTDE